MVTGFPKRNHSSIAKRHKVEVQNKMKPSKARKEGSKTSISKALPLIVARQVAFYLMPHAVESIKSLREWLLAYPIGFLSAKLDISKDIEGSCLEEVKRILQSSNCPTLDITLLCRRKHWHIEALQAFLESSRVEAVGFENEGVNPDVIPVLLKAFVESKNVAHSIKIEFNRPDEKINAFFSEIISKDHALFQLHASHPGYYKYNASLDTIVLDSLSRTSSLHYLHLRHMGLNAEAMRRLSLVLATQSSLKLLDIGRNPIGDEGLSILAECLKTQTTLRYLALAYIEVTNVGACALAKALESNNTLDLLYMKDDDLGIEGGRAFAAMLKVNTALRRLHLEYCWFQQEGCKVFIDALAANRTLKHLRLTHCGISFEDKIELIRVAKEGKSLDILKVGDRWNELSETNRTPSPYTQIVDFAYVSSFETQYARHFSSQNLDPSKGPAIALE